MHLHTHSQVLPEVAVNCLPDFTHSPLRNVHSGTRSLLFYEEIPIFCACHMNDAESGRVSDRVHA